MTPSRDIALLLEIMAALRTPGSGCQWDLEQTFETIAPYTLEEAAEVADAIVRGDRDDLKDELGDLLLQVVFHARMAEEEGSFVFGDVVHAITSKLIRRHPHVFGDARTLSPTDIKAIWNSVKRSEQAERSLRRREKPSLLDGIPPELPSLSQAVKLQVRAGTVGFDWNDPHLVAAKIREELLETEETFDSGDASARAEEIGDLLFAVANLARHLDVDPDMALRQANQKFKRRFNAIEKDLEKMNIALGEASLNEMEALWQKAKADERA